MKTRIKTDHTTDMALVQMGGLHAYLEYGFDSHFSIDGVEFEVVNTNYNHPTGLDALTVENLETGEYTVVFVESKECRM